MSPWSGALFLAESAKQVSSFSYSNLLAHKTVWLSNKLSWLVNQLWINKIINQT